MILLYDLTYFSNPMPLYTFVVHIKTMKHETYTNHQCWADLRTFWW
jgi:hypothetical protein